MKKQILTLLLALAVIGCKAPTKNSGNGGGGNNSGGDSDVGIECGAVVGDKLDGGVSINDGSIAYVTEVFSGNSVAIQKVQEDGTLGGDILVKLQGIKDSPASKRAAAVTRISILVNGGVSFVRAGEDCTAPITGGVTAEVGTLLTSDGVSINEELARLGLVDIEPNDYCGGSLIAGCLQSIYGTTLETAGTLDEFLWKPQSDSNGALAIHTGPYGTDVYVNGEKGVNQGAGNGYGSLARFSKSGCGYPNPRIQVLDGSSGLAYTVGGQTTFTVANPCGRYCPTDGTIQACSK